MHQPLVQTEGSLREVHDAITEMIKQLANEPSVGLYFVQQHVHRAVPAMVQLKTQIVDSTEEAEYVTQDVKDALNSVRIMKEIGPAVIERMMKTLDSSLPRLPSLRQIRRDELSVDSMRGPSLLTDLSENQRTSPKSQSGRELPVTDSDSTGYVRNIFDSAYQKASSVASVAKWTSFSNGKVSLFAVSDNHFVRDDSLGAANTSSQGGEAEPSVPPAGKPSPWNRDFTRPGQYVRGLFSTDNIQPPESWGGWLPTQALRSGFSKLSGAKPQEAIVAENPSEEGDASTTHSLELEGDSYASFAAERAAELEQWLEDVEKPGRN